METKESCSKKIVFIILVFFQIALVLFGFESWTAWKKGELFTLRKAVKQNATQHWQNKTQEAKTNDTEHQDGVNSSFNIIPEIPKEALLLIVINTIPSNFERRITLRGTWAKQKEISVAANFSPSKPEDTMKIAYFFVAGFQGKPTIDNIVEKEAAFYKDILRVSLNETYRSIIHKIWLAFEWLASLDVKPSFVAKADDDVYVKLPDLARWLHENALPPAKLYAGFVHTGVKVIREPSSPWYVSEEQYRDTYFPDYCAGPFYIVSGNVFLEVLNASKVTKSFPVEDAYLGVLVSKIGLKPRITGWNFFHWNRGLNSRALEIEKKEQVPSGIVLGDSLSSEAIQHIHHAYTGTFLNRS